MTWRIRKDKSPQSLKNDAILLWKLGTLSSGQTLTTTKYQKKNNNYYYQVAFRD